MTESNIPLSWGTLEPLLHMSSTIQDGFGGAQKSIVELENGTNVFVKIGTDEITRGKVSKEIAVYSFLAEQGFAHIPNLITYNSDRSGIALEILTPEQGWDWDGPWSEERLQKTLEAMDELASLQPSREVTDYLTVNNLDNAGGAWELGKDNNNLQTILAKRISSSKFSDAADDIDYTKLAAHANEFLFQNDTLVHNDVRRDNCAWKALSKEVKLIDWDWLQMGDKRIDNNSLLVNVQKSGLDVIPSFSNSINVEALFWLADYWFKSAATPIWPGGKAELRDFQLDSALVAYSLAQTISSK